MNDSFFGKYVTSLYFMITTMTTVGYGDIVCISSIERIYHIILLVIGTLLYTFLVSKIGNYLRDQSHEQIKLSKDLKILENIRITYPTMSFKLYTKIKSHLFTIFNKRKKTGLSLLINGVPDAIKNDLLLKIYSKVINEFSIFKDVKNSNFVIQILTSFIPIITKKEEIIILEGEIIENIVFVKDGRLSIEIGLDLNDPYGSIQKYLDNFTGISRQEEINNNIYNKDVSIMARSEKNFNDLKAEIDNVLLDNQNTLVNNSRIDNNGISVDLGRLDFSRNEKEKYNNETFQIIKIIDLRKNEHFGDVHIISEKPAPFTLKAKSRIAELLLIRKHDAIIISKNFPNIWRRLQNKSYHNLVSIKKLTFKILKRYYNTYFYNKNNQENHIALNLDTTGKSFFDNQPSFIKNLKTLNLNNNNRRKSKMIDNINLNKRESKNTINKNKLFVGYEQKKKSLGDFTNELNFSSDSFDSNSFNSSNFKITNSIIKNKHEHEFIPIININDEEINKSNRYHNPNNRFKNSNVTKDTLNKQSSGLYKKKSMENFTFKYDNESNKFNFSSPKKLLSIKVTKNSNFKSSKELKNSISLNNFDTLVKIPLDSKKKSDNSIPKTTSSMNETLRYFNQNTDEINNDNNDINILTLEDVNQNFSRKIKKKIKKRKKLQKLKEILKFQRLKINKNLIDSYIKQNSLIYKLDNNNKEILINNNLNYSISSSNKKIFSQLMDSTTSDATSSLIQNNLKFESQYLKIISSESFEIESNYKNINLLSKGKVTKDINFKKYMENIMSKYINEYNNKESKIYIMSSFSPKQKRVNFGEVTRYNEIEIKKNNDDTFFSEGNITPISNSKYINMLEEIKLPANSNINAKTEKITENFGRIGDDKKSGKNKSSSKFYEKVLDNFANAKRSSLKKKVNEEKTKNDYIGNNIYKMKLEQKLKNTSKKDNKNKKEKINDNLSTNNDINNKSAKSSINAFKEYYDNYYYSTNENRLSILNKNNNNINKKNIQINNFEEEKTKKCFIY
jgi:hypothetical protein